MLAAYNAGPARYDEYLATGRPLPAETRDYVAKLAPVLGGKPLPGSAPKRDRLARGAALRRPGWRRLCWRFAAARRSVRRNLESGVRKPRRSNTDTVRAHLRHQVC